MRRLLPLLLVLLALPATASAAVPQGYTYSDHWFESTDRTRLHAGVFLPADRQEGERHPLVMVIGPYTAPNGGATSPGNLQDVPIRFPELFSAPGFRENRWGVIQVDSRGFGGSGGCFEYYGPGEMRDAGASVEWAAGQPWSTGKVALWGKSYDAASGVLGIAARPEGLAAVVTQAPGLSAYTALWHGGVHYATGRYATTPLYTADDLTPPQNLTTATSADYLEGYMDGLLSDPRCRVDSVVGMNTIGDRTDPFWSFREPYLTAKGGRTPTLWTHGFFDANTKPVHLDVWEELEGPKQAWFGQFAHDRGNETGRREFFLAEAMRFLDLHVRGVDSGVKDPAVTVERGDEAGGWRSEAQWPPADAERWAMPVRAGSYTDTASQTPQAATMLTATKPLERAAHLAGEVKLSVPVTTAVPGTRMIAHLYDVDPDGRGILVTRGALALPHGTGAPAELTFYPQDWRFAEGHRIVVRIAGGDDNWYSPGVTQTTVQVGAGELSLPLLGRERADDLDGVPSNAKNAPTRRTFTGAQLEGAEVDARPPAMKAAKRKGARR